MSVRVERISFEQQIAWKKRPEAARTVIYSRLHKLLAFVLPTMFKPTNSRSGLAVLKFETKKLEQFAKASVNVPKLLEIGGDYIILAHTGTTLSKLYSQAESEEAKAALLTGGCLILADLHNKGLVHGRPHLKDMTQDDQGEIYFIDLEEDPEQVMSLKQAQARDIWLFLLSIQRITGCFQQDLSHCLQQYLSHLDINLKPELASICNTLKPFGWIIKLIGPQRFGRDLTSAYWATKALEQV
ncbi:MAG: hypothetical protein ACPGVN_06160 [Alphaproteobacteria bacterium]